MDLKERFTKLIAAKYPIIYLVSEEEERVCDFLKGVSEKSFSKPIGFYKWTSTGGLNVPADGTDTKDPIAALSYIGKMKETAIFMFCDLHLYFDNKLIIRALKDVFNDFITNFKMLILHSNIIKIPDELIKEMHIEEFPIPEKAELNDLLGKILTGLKNVKVELEENERIALVNATLGLTLKEAELAYNRAFIGRSKIDRSVIGDVLDEKVKSIKTSGILEYVPTVVAIDEIGGFKNFKKWLTRRSKYFSSDADSFNLTIPKGILMTGISGCGKSTAVKAIAATWNIPLFRMDMNNIYSGVSGSAEGAMRRALLTIEAVSPAVLWIDEIEMAFAGYREGDRGVTARIYSSFLTWMQEKTKFVFVAATANEIDKLPPELLRKGRFDEIFFIDLPNIEERVDIIKVHLKKTKNDVAKFDIENLAKATEGYNGAEIEQAVITAMYEAMDESRRMTDRDLYKSIAKMVPLATTMSEAIKVIKRWADNRAVKAS